MSPPSNPETRPVIDAINATGYGLTFGLHTRIDDRVQHVSDRIQAGNIYVNRNQIGAIVGSQPFGGEGLSGTGPKAGGPHYLARFTRSRARRRRGTADGAPECPEQSRAKCQARRTPPARGLLPGPTGESNRLTSLRAPAAALPGSGPRGGQAQARAVSCAGRSGRRGDRHRRRPRRCTSLDRLFRRALLGRCRTRRAPMLRRCSGGRARSCR